MDRQFTDRQWHMQWRTRLIGAAGLFGLALYHAWDKLIIPGAEGPSWHAIAIGGAALLLLVWESHRRGQSWEAGEFHEELVQKARGARKEWLDRRKGTEVSTVLVGLGVGILLYLYRVPPPQFEFWPALLGVGLGLGAGLLAHASYFTFIDRPPR